MAKARGSEASAGFDPSKGKQLNIYVAKSWPAWQQKYIDLVRELFDGVSLDVKSAAKRIEKGEMKRAMPFVQERKRKLESGGTVEGVLNRGLGFDEVGVLKEMVPILKATVTGLREVRIIVVDEQGVDDAVEKAGSGGRSAEPGSPSLEVVNF